jgi:hypothetical protein
MASSDYPSTLTLLGVESLPVSASNLIFAQQFFWAFGYMCLLGSILFKGKYVGMPFTALILNFGWEFAFGMIWVEQLGWEAHGHRGWMLLNFIILYQFVQMEFATKDSKGALTVFWSKIALHFLLAVSIWALFAAFVMETNDYGGVYSSFLIRFVTSLLTTQQLLETSSTPNLYESVLPGIFRLVSTACASLAFLKIVDHSILLSTLCLGCLIWDTGYATIVLYRYNSATPKEKQG